MTPPHPLQGTADQPRRFLTDKDVNDAMYAAMSSAEPNEDGTVTVKGTGTEVIVTFLNGRLEERAQVIEAEARQPDSEDRYSGLIATVRNATEQGLTVHLATRATCAEHLEDIIAGKTTLNAALPPSAPPEAAQPAPLPLDVERLAMALWRALPTRYRQPWPLASKDAERIAAEYARLSQPPAEPTDPATPSKKVSP